jgi:phospho-N-acetylmuramoyl-pentapeptide-transferase
MLYWLSAFSDTIGPLNVLRYITFRSGGAMITALLLACMLARATTAGLRHKQAQSLSADMTLPSALLFATLLWANPVNRYVWIVLGVTLGFGLIEPVAAWLTGMRRRTTSDQVRILVMTIIALAAAAALVQVGRFPSATSLDLLLSKAVDLGGLYVPAAALIIIAAASIINFASRLADTAISPLLISTLGFAPIAYFAGNSFLAEYADMRHVPGSGELTVLCGAALGAGLGCLWSKALFQAILRTDTASLAFGGMVGAVAVATKHEAALALICCLIALSGIRPNLNMNG